MFCINNEKRKKESSLVQRKSERQAIFKFVLSSASGGAGGGKYNRISAFVSIPVLLIRRSLEFFRFTRKNRDDRFCFGFAKVLALALIFTFITTSESWAGKICNCGTKGHETECCWEIKEITSDGKTEKILTVSAGIDNNGGSYKDVQMNDFSSTNDENGNSINNAPWKEYADEITSIEVNGVKNIGDKAFIAMKNVASASMDNSVISVGQQSFSGNKKLASINFSDSLETIDAWAFSGCPKLTTIEIPDTVKSIGGGAFWYYPIATDISVPDSAVISSWFAFGTRNVKIICRGTDETCADMREKLSHYCTNTSSNCVNEDDFIDLSDRVVLADANNCDSSKYYWSGSSCSNKKNGIKCAKNWKQNEDFCNRIRYTPAEAAQVLRDDNTNSVTITFKK